MGHDVAQVILEQADVQRVQDSSHRRNRQVQLEVPARVPSERGHPVAGSDAEPGQCAREPPSALHHLCVVRALDASSVDAHDLPVAEHALGAVRHPPHEQRGAHHQAF